jgi:hypothetical protein
MGLSSAERIPQLRGHDSPERDQGVLTGSVRSAGSLPDLNWSGQVPLSSNLDHPTPFSMLAVMFSMNAMLTGADLLAKVKELGEVSK